MRPKDFMVSSRDSLRCMYDNTDGRLRGRKLQAARLRIWSANPHCAMCGKLVRYPDGFELDHKVAVSKDVDNSDNNLQVLCVEVDQHGNKTGCHVDKTAQDCGYRERVRIGIDGWPEHARKAITR